MRDQVADDRELAGDGQRLRIRVGHHLRQPDERRRAAERVEPHLSVILVVDADDAGVVRKRTARDIGQPLEDVAQIERAGDERQHIRQRLQPSEPFEAPVLGFGLTRTRDHPFRERTRTPPPARPRVVPAKPSPPRTAQDRQAAESPPARRRRASHTPLQSGPRPAYPAGHLPHPGNRRPQAGRQIGRGQDVDVRPPRMGHLIGDERVADRQNQAPSVQRRDGQRFGLVSRERHAHPPVRCHGYGKFSSPRCNSACIRAALHPVWLRCSSLKYCPIFSVVAPCQPRASPLSVRRRTCTSGCWQPANLRAKATGR